MGVILEESYKESATPLEPDKEATASAQAPLEVLGRAVEFVGDFFGTEPRCGNAAALMREIGRDLGYDLKPRPVSFIALKRSTGDRIITGPKAATKFDAEDLKQAETLGIIDPNNGHMVVTNEDPPLLIDANIRQLANGGMSVPSVIAMVESVYPESEDWKLDLTDDVAVWYLLDEDNRALLQGFDAVAASYQDLAPTYAKWLLAGATADQMIRQLLAFNYFAPGEGPNK